MQVLGISFDTPDENRMFAAAQDFPYPLLSDTDRAIGIAYGTAESAETKYAARHTFVIDAEGNIEQAIDTKNPGGQAEALLATL